MNRKYLLFILLIAFISKLSSAQKMKAADIKEILEKANITHEHFTGFALYDEESDKMIYELNADKYFIPASNTKLFTAYTALQMLGDSIPGLQYIIKGDSLVFWGTGDPSFMHPDLNSDIVYHFLKNTDKKLFYSASNYVTQRLRGYWVNPQPFPIGDHVPYMTQRNEQSSTDAYLTAEVLKILLRKPVGVIDAEIPDNASTIYSISADSLYKRMLLPSDNYLAEQILMLCASTFKGPFNMDSVRKYSQIRFLNDLPSPALWTNGAGFPGNMFTPRTLVQLLIKLRDKINNEQRLYNLLPNGGISGTLSEAYKTDNGIPFVFAKTGTLQYVHNQSGYLVTRKGKRMIFSFMNNNFTRPVEEIRAEMVRVMTEIHNKY